MRDIELFTWSYLLILQLLITNKQSNYSVPTMTLHGGSIHIFYLTAPITKELQAYLHFMYCNVHIPVYSAAIVTYKVEKCTYCTCWDELPGNKDIYEVIYNNYFVQNFHFTSLHHVSPEIMSRLCKSFAHRLSSKGKINLMKGNVMEIQIAP